MDRRADRDAERARRPRERRRRERTKRRRGVVVVVVVSSSSFDARAYFARLNTKTEGRVLLTAKTLPSTQRLVSANAADADAVVPDGLICVADVQVSGVGRGGNQWSSPPGCLMFSFLTPHAEGRTLPFLQYVATMAAVEAIQDVADDAMTTARKAAAEDSSSPAPPLPPFRRGTGRTVDARIKWPNDLYSGGVKIGGVLCQSTYANGRFDVVIGVGLNLDNAEPTTCVNEIIAKRLARDGLVVAPGGECTRERLLAGFMNRFEALSGMLSATRSFSGLEASYLRQWLHTDQDVVIEDASGGARRRRRRRGVGARHHQGRDRDRVPPRGGREGHEVRAAPGRE